MSPVSCDCADAVIYDELTRPRTRNLFDVPAAISARDESLARAGGMIRTAAT